MSSHVTAPLTVFAYVNGRTVSLGENSSARFVFDGDVVHVYFKGAEITTLPKGCKCMRDGKTIMLPRFVSGSCSAADWIALVFPEKIADRFVELTVAALAQSVSFPEAAPQTATIIRDTATAVSAGLAAGALCASHLINRGSALLRSKMEPCAEPVRVPEALQAGAAIADSATGFLSQAMGAASSAMRGGLVSLGTAAVAASSRGQQLCSQETAAVARATLDAAVSVFQSSVEAVKTIRTAAAAQAAATVEHKYGDDAGLLARRTLSTLEQAASMAGSVSTATRLIPSRT